MASVCGEHCRERQLRSPVAVAEGMDRIQCGKEVGGLRRKNFRWQVAEAPVLFQFRERSTHLGCYMLRVTEDALTFCYSQRAEPSRPRIYVLKEMMMNRAVVAHAKAPEGERFVPALGSDRRLEAVEVGLVSNVGNVLENARAGIAVGIGRRVVHIRSQTDGLAYPLMIASRRSSAERPS